MVTNPAKMASARLSTASGIPYKLLKQGMNVTMASSTFTETYLMRVVDVAAFIVESFPPPTMIGNIYVPGWPRACPGNRWLTTSAVSFAGLHSDLPTDIWQIDPGAPAGTYLDMLQVEVSYETAKPQEEYDPKDPETFLKHSVSAGGEFLVLPPKHMVGEDSGAIKDFQIPLTKVVPTIEHSLDWSYVLYPPWTAIRDQLGTVNDYAIPLFNNAPPETVLFMSLTGEQQITTAGAKPWSLSYKFSQKQVMQTFTVAGKDVEVSCGWNHLYNPSVAGFERVLRKHPVSGKLYAMYEKSDFLDLFTTEE